MSRIMDEHAKLLQELQKVDQMKLYVWNNPYHVKYGGSFLYVLAKTEEQARDLAATSARVNAYGQGPEEKPLPLKDLGPPERVIEGPAAEIYEWTE